jgi:hypothetical protein
MTAVVAYIPHGVPAGRMRSRFYKIRGAALLEWRYAALTCRNGDCLFFGHTSQGEVMSNDSRYRGTPPHRRSVQPVWRFVENGELGRQRWTWRRKMTVDGAIEAASRDFPSYAAAVMDAVSKGFRPKSEPYLVESLGRLIRFEPGRRPVTIVPVAPRRAAAAANAAAFHGAAPAPARASDDRAEKHKARKGA